MHEDEFALRYYILDGKTPVRVDRDVWSKWWLGHPDRHVAYDSLPGGDVSTIFLLADHTWFGDESPRLFETMIFGGLHDYYQERCSTWEEAEAQHAKAVALVKGR